MADENNAFALICKFTEDIHDFLLCISVKVSRRLVCKDNVRIVRERTGNCHSLLLTARELQNTAVRFVLVKSYAIEKL